MNKLTQEEFTDRVRALHEATHIFSKMTDGDITAAFEAYQSILADKERPLQLNSHDHGNRNRALLDEFTRPKCPDCDHDLMFRPLPENSEDIQTQLVCSNADCDTVLNSENHVSWWIEELKRETANGSI